MTIKFNTAYQTLKEELTFTKFKGKIELLKNNRVQANPTHSNSTARAQHIGVITDSMKRKTSEKIKESTYLSLMTADDINWSIKECEIVYAQMLHQGRPVNILFGHFQVQRANAQGMLNTVSGHGM